MSSESFQNLILIGLVFIGSALGTALIRFLARRYGWLVLPRKDRWHKAPTALHGGAGFYPFFLIGALWILIRHYGSGTGSPLGVIPNELSLAAMLILGSLVMFAFGLWDDIKQFRPATKLLFEFAAASLFISAGGVFQLSGNVVVDLLITYLWFVGIINAVNMLDNMDGLASGVVVLAASTLVLLAMGVHGFTLKGVLALPFGLLLAASLAGFWLHNRPPASIFMGDSGSLSIGYILAALAVPSALNGFMGINTNGRPLGPMMVLLIPVTVLAIPIFDTTLVTVTRTLRSQKPSDGGQDHSSHRLVGLGLSEKRAVWVLYSLAAFGGSVAVLMQHFPSQSLPLFGAYALALIITGVYLGHVKLKKIDASQPPPVWTPLVSNFLYKRRAAEVLLDTVLIIGSFYGAYLLRFDGSLSPQTLTAVMTGIPIVLTSCLFANFLGGIYRGQWRLISVPDLPNYLASVLGGVGLSLAVLTLVTRFEVGNSRSAFIIFGLLLFLSLSGSRLSFRLLDAVLRRNTADWVSTSFKPVLIYGAGYGGKLLYGELYTNPALSEYTVVGFIDDDPNRAGRSLCGLPVRFAADWLRRPWDPAPEIWVSSRKITNDRARRTARGFENGNGPSPVYRLKLQIEPVSGGRDAAPENGPSVPAETVATQSSLERIP
jgi:UDP-GlcNAc:undecaprenyl-phosphate GlcNAc-1-phosphate transferase